jgi:hypothetical protein
MIDVAEPSLDITGQPPTFTSVPISALDEIKGKTLYQPTQQKSRNRLKGCGF